MTGATLRLGTRRSALATTQSRHVAEAITARTGRGVELVEVTTRGDVDQGPLTQIGGTGVFVSALREALLDGRVDLAVHSLKDLPTADPDGIVLAAVPPREDPRDALVARDGLGLSDLPAGSRVGTGSPRRAAQLRALGFGLDIVPVRGNVDTRISLVRAGTVDAVVLARAGLARLDRLDEVTEVLDPLQMLPAPGQGALAVETRRPDGERAGPDEVTRTLVGALDDPTTRAAVTAERTLLATLEAGCMAPVGAYAEVGEGDDGLEIYLRAVVVSLDGATSVRRTATGRIDEPEKLGAHLAQELLSEGVANMMGSVDE